MTEFVRTLSYLVSPELALIAEVDGRGVGAVLGCRTTIRAHQADSRRLLPFWLRAFAAGRKDVRRIRIISINVVPEYQRWGLGLVLLRSLVPKALSMGVEEAEFSWIAESNVMPRVGLEKMNATLKNLPHVDLDPPATAERPGDRNGGHAAIGPPRAGRLGLIVRRYGESAGSPAISRS